MKMLLTMLIALLCAFGLSACGSTSPATGAASAGVPTVTIWGYGGQEVREALQLSLIHISEPTRRS